jgi:hypothetical protein
MFLAATLGSAAFYGIPLIPYIYLRFFAWAIYGYVQGCFMTGLWVSALEKWVMSWVF